jgi:hypothetical protein
MTEKLSRSILYRAAGPSVRLNLPTSARVLCRVYSIAGREVHRSSLILPAGRHVVELAPKALARGAYLAAVRVENESFQCRFIIGK